MEEYVVDDYQQGKLTRYLCPSVKAKPDDPENAEWLRGWHEMDDELRAAIERMDAHRSVVMGWRDAFYADSAKRMAKLERRHHWFRWLFCWVFNG